MMPVVILISGRGSNLEAILTTVADGGLPIRIAAVISNNPTAAGLAIARAAGIPTETVDHRRYPDRAGFEAELMRSVDRHAPALVVLAGFMRILGDDFIRHYAGRLMNIHPSLLPKFKGLDTHARALAAHETRHGASVHFVTPEVDGGPVIVQAAVPVRPDDTPETLAARVLVEEHRILPLAIGWFAQHRLTLHAGRALLDGARRPEQGMTDNEEHP